MTCLRWRGREFEAFKTLWDEDEGEATMGQGDVEKTRNGTPFSRGLWFNVYVF